MYKIIIWGTGVNAQACFDFLDKDKCEIIAFVESAPQKEFHQNIHVIAPNKLLNIQYDYLFVASQYFEQIETTINNNGITLKNVIIWINFTKNIYSYDKNIRQLFNNTFLGKYSTITSNRKWVPNKKNSALCSKELEIIEKKQIIYVYSLDISLRELSISKLLEIIINLVQNKEIDILFVPNEKMLDIEWYNKLLNALDYFCLVAWKKKFDFYLYCFEKYSSKFSFLNYNSLLPEKLFLNKHSQSQYMILEENSNIKKLQSKLDFYDKIEIYQLRSTRIGEFIKRVNYILKIDEKIENIYRIYIPTELSSGQTTSGANACFTELVSRKINMLTYCDIDIIIKNIFINPMKYSFFKDLNLKKVDTIFTNKLNNALIDFYPEENEKGKALLKNKFQIKPFEYVCIFSRDADYLSAIFPNYDYSYHNYRDISFDILNKSIQYFDKKKIKAIRVGQIARKIKNNSCVDFPNICYDEFIDLMLHKNCKFLLSSESGVIEISRFFGRPLAQMGLCYPLDSSCLLYKKEDIYIFNKLKSIKENRILSFKETFKLYYEFQFEHKYDFQFFKDREITIIPHTEEEVCDMAIEMNEKLDYTWKEQEEDGKLREAFSQKLTEALIEKKMNWNILPQWPISMTFLRKNRKLFLEE